MNGYALTQNYTSINNKYIPASLIFGGAFISVYFLPTILAKFFFIGLFLYAYKSKQYGILAAFYLTLLMNPCNLFRSAELPVFRLAAGQCFGIYDILGFILLFRALHFNKKFLFKNIIVLLLILTGFYFISSFFDGSDVSFAVSRMRMYFLLTSYFVFSAFLSDKREFNIFIKICLFFAILGIIDQIYSIISHNYLISFFTNIDYTYQISVFKTGEIRSFSTAFTLMYFLLVFYMCNVFDPESRLHYKNWFLALFLTSILLTGTRQWFINLTVLLGLILIKTKEIKKIIMIPLFLLMVTILMVMLNIIDIGYINKNIIQRYATIIDISSGDTTSVNARMNDYEHVLANIRENFILGMGFKADHSEISNDIGGFFNNWARFGIIGTLLFLFVFIIPIKKTSFFIKKHNNTAISVLYASWIALLIQYIAVHDFFSFYTTGVSLIMLLLSYTELTIMGKT